MLSLEPEFNTFSDGKAVLYLNVSLWLLGYNSNPSIWQRLRHCWRILKTGQNYSDQIILNYESTKQLNKDLSSIMCKYKEA
jgi:hypothetical protein